MPPPAGAPYGSGIAAYARLLARHKGFRTLWCGELLNSAGGWFAYVATLRRVVDLAPPSAQGRLLAAVLATHYIPGLFLFPVAGVLADRAPRELVLAGACGVGAASAAALVLVRGPGDLALMLCLLVVQHSATTCYEVCRRSITPTLVPAGEALRLASTLDSVGWSLMSAVGASAGGTALAAWGYGTCYLIDAVTYAAAGAAALSLRGQVAASRAGGGGGGGIDGRKQRVELARRLKARQSDGAEVGGGGGGGGEEEEAEGALPPPPPPPPPPPSTSSLSAAFRAAAADVRAGFAYVAAPAHRGVLILACVKAGGSTVWGAADLINTYVSEAPGAQASAAAASAAWAALTGRRRRSDPTPDSLAATVLGAIFACVGVGCFVGPLISNAAIPTPTRAALNRGIAAAFACLAVGYVGIASLSTSLAGICISTSVRAAGSSILWAYSTLLLQMAVPDALLGRVCALEQAAFVTGECVSALGAAWMFDAAAASVAAVATVMAGVAGVVATAWYVYCRRLEAESEADAQGHGHGGEGDGQNDTDTEAAAAPTGK